MNIYTNEGNPLALGLVLCAKANESKSQDVAVKKVSITDSDLKTPKHLPTLALSDGTQLFSVITAANYLLPSSNDEWLVWSQTDLIPVLQLFYGGSKGSKPDAAAKTNLNKLLKKLDDQLKKNKFVQAGPNPSAADFILWSLLGIEKTLKEATDVENIKRWFKDIESLAVTKDALQVLPLKNLKYSSLSDCNRFGGFLHLLPSSAQSSAQTGPALLDSPTTSEVATPEEIVKAKETFKYVEPLVPKEAKTILPKIGERNILITSALPYVNNVPHLGNIIGCVLSADIFARYARSCGYNTLFVCGTDEYGTATETKALQEGLTPKQICDKYFEIHNSIYRWFGIGFDYFGRTSTPEQTEIVQAMFKDLQAAGFIETQSVEQLLCQKCDRYLADRFVEGTCPHPGCGYEDARGDQCDKCGKLINAIDLIKPRCKVCNTAPVVRTSKQFFIDLPKIEPKLQEWFKSVESGWTNNARVITKSWLKEGLKSRCITRDLKWGIPVPAAGFEGKVFYVWFDAPIGYISITSRYTKEWKQWWQPKKEANVELFQFMAKDNVPFHSVMFPATLLGINKGHTLVSHIMATEYLNYEDGKFSKSRGLGVFGNDAQDTGIPSDVWRFYLASARPEGQDSSFSWNDLATRNNSELLNNLGNFCNRALVFCEKNFDSTVPTINPNDDDWNLIALVNREYAGYVASMEKAKYRDGIKYMLAISRHGNQYMQVQQAWVLLKGTDDQKTRAGTVIALACNLSCLLATLLFPFMPDTARNLFKQLNIAQGYVNSKNPVLTILLRGGHKIGKPVPLFTKIEQARVDELKARYGGTQATNGTNTGAKTDASNKLFNTVAECEAAVTAQGEKVRQLKSSGVEKSVWQPEVTILLELKKQLAALQAKVLPTGGELPPVQTFSTKQPADPADVKALEEQITKQGERVRQLKTSGAEKTVWQPEVETLLALKAKLAELTGVLPQPPSGKSKKKK